MAWTYRLTLLKWIRGILWSNLKKEMHTWRLRQPNVRTIFNFVQAPVTSVMLGPPRLFLLFCYFHVWEHCPNSPTCLFNTQLCFWSYTRLQPRKEYFFLIKWCSGCRTGFIRRKYLFFSNAGMFKEAKGGNVRLSHAIRKIKTTQTNMLTVCSHR